MSLGSRRPLYSPAEVLPHEGVQAVIGCSLVLWLNCQAVVTVEGSSGICKTVSLSISPLCLP